MSRVLLLIVAMTLALAGCVEKADDRHTASFTLVDALQGPTPGPATAF
jgi:hypothetical protein